MKQAFCKSAHHWTLTQYRQACANLGYPIGIKGGFDPYNAPKLMDDSWMPFLRSVKATTPNEYKKYIPHAGDNEELFVKRFKKLVDSFQSEELAKSIFWYAWQSTMNSAYTSDEIKSFFYKDGRYLEVD